MIMSFLGTGVAGDYNKLAYDFNFNDLDGSILKLEHLLSPYVAFGIMPLFALANAGVDLKVLLSTPYSLQSH